VKCQHCGENFHQTGSLWWYLLPFFSPSFAVTGLYWLFFAVALALVGGIALWALLLLRYPLKAGPRFG
jgi:hypothetical protein